MSAPVSNRLIRSFGTERTDDREVSVREEAVPEKNPMGVSSTCDLTTTCPYCDVEMIQEHAHMRCEACGYRDSCCF